MKLIPSKQQWNSWSLPSKLTTISAYLGLLSIILTIFIWLLSIMDSSVKTIYDSSKGYEIQVDSAYVKLFIKDTSVLVKEYSNPMKDYKIVYPLITYKNNTYIEGKINKMIKDFFASRKVNLSNINKSAWSGEIICSYDIVYKIHNLLGIRINLYWYGTGAMHGNQEVITYNINLKNGDKFDYQEIFIKKYDNVIKEILIQKLYKFDCYCINKDVDFNYNDSRDFYFEFDGLMIVFPKYEVACGVCGPIEIKLLYSEIKKFVNLNGPLVFL